MQDLQATSETIPLAQRNPINYECILLHSFLTNSKYYAHCIGLVDLTPLSFSKDTLCTVLHSIIIGTNSEEMNFLN